MTTRKTLLSDAFSTIDGREWKINHASQTVHTDTVIAARVYRNDLVFPPTEFTARALRQLVLIGPISTSSTLRQYTIGIHSLTTYVAQQRYEGWSAEAFAGWLSSMRHG